MKKQSNGYYRTKVVVGHEPTGKPINKWVSAKTKKELEAKKQEVIDQYINGNKTLVDMTFGEYTKSWYEIKKKPFISKGTQNQYRSIINNRLYPVFRDRKLSTITSIDVQAYINTLSSLSESRAHAIANTMKAILGAAFADGYMRNNPIAKVRVESAKPKEKHILNLEERERIEDISHDHIDGLMLGMLYYTGMRDGELCALRWKDIDLAENQIHITSSLKHDDGTYIGPTKTASSVRSVPIPDPLREIIDIHIKEYSPSPEDFVVHLRSDPSRPVLAYEFRIRWSRLMEACKLGHPEEVTRNIHWRPLITPHALRHNFTTILYENGIDPYTAAKLLGHSSINTTMDIYTHFSKKAMEQAKENLDNIWKVAQK